MSAASSGSSPQVCTAFEDSRRLAHGPLDQVVRAAKAAFDGSRTSSILIFDDATGEQIDVDFSGSPAEVARLAAAREARRLPPPEGDPAVPRGRGRPRLGVVAREVTLLPRHWQWLSGQPGGASVALRRLVDEARRTSVGRDRVRRAQEVAYRVTTALAGNLPGFEEAIRGLFARNGAAFHRNSAGWPDDVREYTRALAAPVFDTPEAP
ncbi:MAG: DUF2239 family protein [Vicinamibacterales bacterium]